MQAAGLPIFLGSMRCWYNRAHSALVLQTGGLTKLEPVFLTPFMQTTVVGSPSPRGVICARATFAPATVQRIMAIANFPIVFACSFQTAMVLAAINERRDLGRHKIRSLILLVVRHGNIAACTSFRRCRNLHNGTIGSESLAFPIKLRPFPIGQTDSGAAHT